LSLKALCGIIEIEAYVKKLRRCPMKVYDFKVLLEPDEEAGGYVVSCPSLPGCYTQGDTIDEALDNIKEAILLCLEDMQAQNQPIPDVSRTLVSSVAVAL
jgi:antitoxin HicB